MGHRLTNKSVVQQCIDALKAFVVASKTQSPGGCFHYHKRDNFSVNNEAQVCIRPAWCDMMITWYRLPSEVDNQLQSLELDVECLLPEP